MEEDKIREMMKIFSKLANGSSANAKKIAEVMGDEFLYDHRTLQQNMTRILYEFFKYVAENSRGSDDRNAQSMVYIKAVAEIETYFPFI